MPGAAPPDPPNDLLEAAVAYAQLGLRVLPLKPRSKTPDGRLVLHGLHDASADEATIRAWWQAEPHANIAVAVSAAHIVVDVDDGGESSLDGRPLPATWTARTGGGGRHHWFALPQGVTARNAVALLPHVDVRTSGGYVLVPPSIHPTGATYEWPPGYSPWECDLAPAPEWLLALLRDRARRPEPTTAPAAPPDGGDNGRLRADLGELAVQRYAQVALEDEVAAVAQTAPGGRNARLNQAAFSLGGLVSAGALDPGEVERRLLDACAMNGLLSEDGERACRATLRSGLDAGQRAPRDLSSIGRQRDENASSEPRRNGLQARDVAPGRDATAEPAPEPPATEEPLPTGADSADHLTDLDLARRFVRQHGHDVLYVPNCGWSVWDGRRWARDETLEVQRRIAETGRKMWAEVASAREGDARRALVRAANRACSLAGQSACEFLSRSMVVVTRDRLDADPDLLNCLNGTIHLPTGALRPHRREDLITRVVPTRYDPDAQCPRFQRFLAQAVPDADSRDYLLRLLGYGLSGHTRERVFVLAIGPPAGGKSTLMAVLLGVLGDYARPLSADAWSEARGLDDLRAAVEFEGARLLVGSEVRRRRPWRVALLKSITGGSDLVLARPLYSETFSFKPQCLCLMFVNGYPDAASADPAFWERLRVIQFPRTVPEPERDPHLVDALLAESEGILALLVRAATEWYAHGLGPQPVGVRESGLRYRREEDIIGGFLAEHTILDPRGMVPARELRESYENWCRNEGEEPLSETAFGRDLRERGFQSDRRRVAGVVTRVWRGLRLLESSPSGGDGTGPEVVDAEAIGVPAVTGVTGLGHFAKSPLSRARIATFVTNPSTCHTCHTPDPTTYAQASVEHTVNRRGVSAEEQQADIALGLAAEDEFARLLARAGIRYQRPPKRVTSPDPGADFILADGRRVDVKCTRMPGRAILCGAQTPQEADDMLARGQDWLAHFYAARDGTLHFLGVIPLKEFLDHSTLVPEGDLIPGPGEFVAHYDLHCMHGDALKLARPLTVLREAAD